MWTEIQEGSENLNNNCTCPASQLLRKKKVKKWVRETSDDEGDEGVYDSEYLKR